MKATSHATFPILICQQQRYVTVNSYVVSCLSISQSVISVYECKNEFESKKSLNKTVEEQSLYLNSNLTIQ